MEMNQNQLIQKLYERAQQIISPDTMAKANRKGEGLELKVPEAFERDFLEIINRVSLSLMEEKDHFYGYFLFQMGRIIRFDISSPTAVKFQGAKYVICFNPLIFLNLTPKQMEATIKHEILHILSLHLVRAQDLKGSYSTLAKNLAMDLVVNQHLNNLPPYATTLDQINTRYGLALEPYETFEYYVEAIQIALHLLEEDEEGEEEDSQLEANVVRAYDPQSTHDVWEESDEVEANTLRELTEKFMSEAQKGETPAYLEGILATLKNSKGELPWNIYLNRLMGTIESQKKKTITRRNRRQPHRLDLRGELRSHKAKIAVALDISGSISDEEFKQAMQEVLSIVKNYNHEITLIECDHQIRRCYQVRSTKSLKERMPTRGGTQFTPVFEYANHEKLNLLIYFTDGKGEERVKVIPRGYKVLWVISGRGDQLSLKTPYGAVKKLSQVSIKESSLEMSDVRSDGYSMNHQEPIF